MQWSEDQSTRLPWPSHWSPGTCRRRQFRISGFQYFEVKPVRDRISRGSVLGMSTWNTIDRPPSSLTHISHFTKSTQSSLTPRPPSQLSWRWCSVWGWWRRLELTMVWQAVGELRTGAAPPPLLLLAAARPGTHKTTPGQKLGTQLPPFLQGRQNI